MSEKEASGRIELSNGATITIGKWHPADEPPKERLAVLLVFRCDWASEVEGLWPIPAVGIYNGLGYRLIDEKGREIGEPVTPVAWALIHLPFTVRY